MEGTGKFTFEPVCDVYTEGIKKQSIAPKQSNAEVIVHPSECVLTINFQQNFHRIRDFKVYPDDTWIVTFPKSGTTWTQEMIWLLTNNLDFQTAKTTNLRFRCPFLELETIMSQNKLNEETPKTIEYTENLKRPRCIKSHLPLQLLPKELWTVKPKIIYVARDPRDVAISYYHHHRLWNGYQGKLEDFTDVFLADRVVYAPYWKHVLDFWNLKDKSHVHFNNFEEMKKDLAEVIRKTAKFLEVDLTEKQVDDLKQHLSFNNMKNNNCVNYIDVVKEVKEQINVTDEKLVFMREGESGRWAKTYSDNILEKFQKWNEKNLAGTPYKDYPYSLK